MGMDFGSADASVMVVASPLAEGELLIMNTEFLKPKPLDFDLKVVTAELDLFKAQVDAYSHATDALRYALMQGSAMTKTAMLDLPTPPPTPPGLTPEQHAAHLAIHDLVSAEEFEVLYCDPGFVQLNAYWGQIGERKFCCEKAMPWDFQRGYAKGAIYTSAVNLNHDWMAKTEAAPVRRSAWEKLKATFSAGRRPPRP